MKMFVKKGKLFALLAALVLCCMAFAAPVAVNASSGELVTKAFEEEGTMFNQTESVVRQTGNSLKSLIQTIAIIVLVISVIFVGMQFTSKNSAKRQEAKSNLGAIIIGAILIFAAVAVISLSGTIADALDSSVKTPSSGQNVTGAPDPTDVPKPSGST